MSSQLARWFAAPPTRSPSTHRRMRAGLVAAWMLALAACAGAPGKSAAPPPAAGQADATAAASPAPAGRRKSPYAPAQEDPSKRGDYVAGGLYAPGVRDSIPDEILDVDAIPEPDVVDEPRSRVGNRQSYSVLGKQYRVLDSADGYVESGTASYYGKKFHGRRTSNLEVYDMYAFSAAHRTLPLPSFVRVTNLDNGRSVIVRVNDRGPFHAGRLIDLSYAAATKLGYVQKGTARVEVRALVPDRQLASRPPTPPAPVAPPPPAPASPTGMDRLIAAMPIASAAAAEAPVASGGAAPDYRFDMRQDGRTMSADEFEAWMKARQVRIATGRPGTPAPREAPPTGAASTGAASTPAAPTGAAPADAAPRGAAEAAPGTGVTLQVASFAARANADRALAMLQDAGIGAARLSDGDAHGQKVWRLRVGPLAEGAAPELAARIAGLGFGPPQRVRE